MAQITLNIHGRDYNMACDDGEEDRIRQLAGYLNTKLDSIAKSGAAKNEMHLFMLTGLVLADEVFDLKSGKLSPSFQGVTSQQEDEIRLVVDRLIERIQQLSQKLEQKTV